MDDLLVDVIEFFVEVPLFEEIGDEEEGEEHDEEGDSQEVAGIDVVLEMLLGEGEVPGEVVELLVDGILADVDGPVDGDELE